MAKARKGACISMGCWLVAKAPMHANFRCLLLLGAASLSNGRSFRGQQHMRIRRHKLKHSFTAQVYHIFGVRPNFCTVYCWQNSGKGCLASARSRKPRTHTTNGRLGPELMASSTRSSALSYTFRAKNFRNGAAFIMLGCYETGWWYRSISVSASLHHTHLSKMVDQKWYFFGITLHGAFFWKKWKVVYQNNLS